VPKVALLVYNAILKTFPAGVAPDVSKLCKPFNISALKVLVTADVIAIIFFS
jgi:hypothetical protein